MPSLCRRIANIDRRLNTYLYNGPPWRAFRVCVLFVFTPLLVILAFLFLASSTDSDVMKHNQGKYLERRTYAGEAADVFTLPGHGFNKNAQVKLHVEAGYSTLVASHFGDRSMMYIYICEYVSILFSSFITEKKTNPTIIQRYIYIYIYIGSIYRCMEKSVKRS